MRMLSALFGLGAVTAMVYLLIARDGPNEAELRANCAQFERRLAALRSDDATGETEARGATKAVLESLVSDCRRNGLAPAG